MANEYDKNNILLVPELRPIRHYESEGVISSYYEEKKKKKEREEPLLDVLEDLDRVYRLASLLPAGLADIIKKIVNELSLDTQGKIIQKVQEQEISNPPPDDPLHPTGTTPKTDPPIEIITKPTPKTILVPPYQMPKQSTPSAQITPDTDTDVTILNPEGVPFFKPIDTTTAGHIEFPEDEPDERTFSTQTYTPIGEWNTAIARTNEAEFVENIFSEDPIFTVSPAPLENLVKLSRDAYFQDDSDIKKYFTGKMLDLTQRFFQVMDTIATEAGMPDHSFLMQAFDGTAVKTKYPNKQHLIDYISKNQVIYDQKERFMKKTHTARNTLIRMRSMTSSEGQRERYLKEEYDKDKSTYSKDFSNDLLEKSRDIANDNYKESAYNFFKYLNSAVEQTNTMLNIKIDEGMAKAELAATGSDIYAITPPPNATSWNIDDNKKSVDDNTKKAQDAVNSQSKDGITGTQAMDGGGTGSSYAGGVDADFGSVGGGNVEPLTIYQMLRKVGYSKVAACGIMGNIQIESTFNTKANGGKYLGLCQWDINTRWIELTEYAKSKNKDPYDAAIQIEFLYKEATTTRYPDECAPDAMNQYSTPEEAAHAWNKWFEVGAKDAERQKEARTFFNTMPD